MREIAYTRKEYVKGKGDGWDIIRYYKGKKKILEVTDAETGIIRIYD